MSSRHSTRKRVEQSCAVCGLPYTAVLCEVRRGRASKTCGRKCYRVYKGYEKNDAIKAMLGAGRTWREIRESLHVSPATIAKCVTVKRGPLRYDWDAIREMYDGGASYAECRAAFGVCHSSMTEAAKRGLFKPRPALLTKMSVAEYIPVADGRRHSRYHLRQKILSEGTIPYVCAICGIDEWNGKELTLRLDHIDGDGRRHALDNLRFLCPNCDSQQPTYGHRNRGRYSGDVSQPA